MHGSLLAFGQFLRRTPKFTSAALILAAMCVHTLAFAQEAQVLTNADIIKMVEIKLGTDQIVRQIRDNPGKYSLSTNSLVELKEAGVPNAVIAAMQAKKPASIGQQGTAVSKNPGPVKAQSAQDPFAWDVQDVLDRMSGTTHVLGYLSQRPSPNSSEQLQAVATCGTYGSRGLNLLLIYVSGTNPPAGLKQNIPEAPPQNMQSNATTTTVGIVGTGIGGIAATLFGAAASLAANVAASSAAAHAPSAPQLPWVDMQMKFDNEGPISFRSTNQFSNYATVSLAAEDVLKASHSNTLLFALPHEDGSPIYFEIRPQEPSFKRLAEKCNAYPPTVPELMMSGEFGQELTVKQFADVVPQVLEAYTAGHHLPPDTYTDAASKLKDIVSSCSMITEPMVFSVTDGAYDVESLDRLGDGFRECNNSGVIDLSRLSGKNGGSADASAIPQSSDLLLKISHRPGDMWKDNSQKGFLVSVEVGDIKQLLIDKLKIKATPISSGPKFWVAPTNLAPNNYATSCDGGLSQICFDSYVAGPTWVPVGGNVKVSYRVHTKIAPNSNILAEFLRAPDVGGKPGSWSVINFHNLSLNGDWTNVTFVDKPSEIGRYWYGTRVVDAGHREAHEPAALLVNVSPPPTAEMTRNGIFPPGTDIVLSSR